MKSFLNDKTNFKEILSSEKSEYLLKLKAEHKTTTRRKFNLQESGHSALFWGMVC